MTSILKEIPGVAEVKVEFEKKKAIVKGKNLDSKNLCETLDKKSEGQYTAKLIP